ncbi:hypothetical protein IJ579_03100 [bacterium]|nr:hypothetical protein [bacterium]
MADIYTNIKVKFKEFNDRTYNKDESKEIDGKYVYIFRTTSYIPKDGIPVYVNEKRIKKGEIVEIPIYEGINKYKPRFYICVSLIKLSEKRIEFYRQQINNAMVTNSLKVERFDLLPVDFHVYNPTKNYGNIDCTYNSDTVTIYLKDLVSIASSESEKYQKLQKAYSRYCEGLDDFPNANIQEWKITRNQSIVYSQIMGELLADSRESLIQGNYISETKKHINIEEWTKWYKKINLENEDYLKKIIEIQIYLACIMLNGMFNAQLNDYEWSLNANERNKVEEMFCNIFEPLFFTSELISSLYSILNLTHDFMVKNDESINSEKLEKENGYWLANYLLGVKDVYGTLKSCSEATDKILTALVIPISKMQGFIPVWEYIVDHRYHHNVVSFDCQIRYRGRKLSTDYNLLSDTNYVNFKKRIYDRYDGDIRFIEDNNVGYAQIATYFPKKMKSRLENARITINGIVIASIHILNIFELCCNTIEFFNSSDLNEKDKNALAIKIISNICDIGEFTQKNSGFLTKFAKIILPNNVEVLKKLSFTRVCNILAIICSGYDYIDSVTTLLKVDPMDHDLLAKERLNTLSNMCVFSSSLCSAWLAYAASCGTVALAANTVPFLGQIVCIGLLLVGLGISLYANNRILTDFSHKWLRYSTPFGKNYKKLLSSYNFESLYYEGYSLYDPNYLMPVPISSEIKILNNYTNSLNLIYNILFDIRLEEILIVNKTLLITLTSVQDLSFDCFFDCQIFNLWNFESMRTRNINLKLNVMKGYYDSKIYYYILAGNIYEEDCKQGVREVIRKKQNFIKEYDKKFLNKHFRTTEEYFLKFSELMISEEKIIDLINLMSSVNGNVFFRVSINIPEITLCRHYETRININNCDKKTLKTQKYLNYIENRKENKTKNIVVLPNSYK